MTLSMPVALIAILNIIFVTLLPRIFFRQDGIWNLKWLLTAAPYAVNPIFLLLNTEEIAIWEPVVFFLLFWISLDIINNKYQKINFENLTKLLPYLPAVFVAIYIIFNPMTLEQHNQMVKFLANNFNEECYMSCGLLKSKSTIFQQFQVNFSKYSFEVFLRYFLIIIIGFGPLFILLFYSKLKEKNLIFFKYFNNLLIPFLFILSPVLVLFAMGYDWGRWVNISYVFSIICYVY